MPIGTIEEAFLNFIAGVELTEQSIEPALVKSRQLIKLAKKEFRVNGYFYGGPYRRGTGVRSDKLRLQLVLGSKYYYDFRENSTKLLYFLRNRLQESAGSALHDAGRILIGIDYPGSNLELVPSIKIKPTGYLCPNGLGGWHKTNPDREEVLFKAKDETSSGRFLKLAKVIKAWNIFIGKPFDSYYLELLIYYRANDFTKTFAELVHSFFAGMSIFMPEFLNCPAADEIVSCGLTESARKQVLDKAFDITSKAVDEYENEISLILWRKLFGSGFGRVMKGPSGKGPLTNI